MAVLLVAAVAAFGSLVIAWRNTRYVIQRVEALAAPGVASPDVDEIDAIDRRLTSLGAEAANVTEAARKRASEFAALVAEVASGSRQRVEEARMPVHILLTTQFGELNENQEEMLDAADSAMTALDEELAKLRTIADVDRGTLRANPERVRVSEVLRSMHAMMLAEAEKAQVQLVFDIEPALPCVMADVQQLRDALRLTMTGSIHDAPPGVTVTVNARSTPSTVAISVDPGSPHVHASSAVLAARIIAAQGGTVEFCDARTIITLRRESCQRDAGVRDVSTDAG
jgi:hypothetical protein